MKNNNLNTHETEIYKILNVDIPEEEIDLLFNNYLEEYYNPEKFYNDIKSQNRQSGLDIKQSDNEYSIDPFNSKSNNYKKVFKNVESKVIDIETIKRLDLNWEIYSAADILHLFNLETGTLTRQDLRNAKKLVLKMHPDKSYLEPKYFLFFMKAYNHIEERYKCQKYEKKYDEERIGMDVYKNDIVLEDSDDPFFNEYEKERAQYMNDVKKHSNHEFCQYEEWLHKNKKLNLWKEWRDNKFEKNIFKNGYGDWLKSDEGLYEEQYASSIDDLNQKIEKIRREVTTLAIHNGVNKINSNISKGTALIDVTNNFTKLNIPINNDNTLQYTDIKEAFTESLYPVEIQEISMKKDIKPDYNYSDLAKEVWNNRSKDVSESLSTLYNQKDDENIISPALAYHYASKSI